MSNLASSPKAALSGRHFLGTALAGTAATLADASSISSVPNLPSPRATSRPDEVLRALLEGNERYMRRSVSPASMRT